MRPALRTIAQLLVMGVLCCTALACSSFSPDEPPIPDSTLIEVLTELHLAAARTEVRKDPPLALRDSILARYGVDEARLRAATEYYSKHPAAYESLYDAVLDSLNTHRSTLHQPYRSSLSK